MMDAFYGALAGALERKDPSHSVETLLHATRVRICTRLLDTLVRQYDPRNEQSYGLFGQAGTVWRGYDCARERHPGMVGIDAESLWAECGKSGDEALLALYHTHPQQQVNTGARYVSRHPFSFTPNIPSYGDLRWYFSNAAPRPLALVIGHMRRQDLSARAFLPIYMSQEFFCRPATHKVVGMEHASAEDISRVKAALSNSLVVVEPYESMHSAGFVEIACETSGK